MISRKILLTSKRLETLSAVAQYRDTKVSGLLFQISRKGGRSFIFRYSMGGRERQYGMGPVAHFKNVDEAREVAWGLRKMVREGTDPIEARRGQKANAAAPDAASITFDEAADRLITSLSPGWKSKKHGAQWRSTLNYATPFIGALPVNKIGTAEVMKVLEQPYEGTTLWNAIPETASRLRQRMESVLDWAKARGFRAGENPAHWRGHLDSLLPASTKLKKKQHHPALAYTDIPAFFADLRRRKGIARLALEFTVLTCKRTNEVTRAKRSEVNWETGVWVIPAERMKMKREHRVPLQRRALEILRELPLEAGNDHLFIGLEAGAPISNAAMAKLLRDMGWPSTTPDKLATVHGMRSSFRDWAAEVTNFPRELAEAALAHALPDKTEAAYQRGDLLAKRRRMAEAWAAYCASPVRKTGEVLPIRKVAS
jgi:integrase